MFKNLDKLKEEYLEECLAYTKNGQNIHPDRVREIIKKLVDKQIGK